MTVINLNRLAVGAEPINVAIEEALNAVAGKKEPRLYLGASAIGGDCLRKIQFDWMCASKHPARTQRIFARGNAMEQVVADAFRAAGFDMERGTPACGFSAMQGLFQGHCDGIIRNGPDFLTYPCLWEHKALGSKGWKQIEKHGLRSAYAHYFAQVQVYQAYLNLTENPALFTALNSDTCELLHILVPFEPETAQAWSDRAVRIVEATMAHELLPRVAEKPDDWRCKMCSHKDRCWSDD